MLTHFIVSDDVERSRRFYSEVLGGEIVREGEPSFVALANSWMRAERSSSRRRRTAAPRSAAICAIRMGT